MFPDLFHGHLAQNAGQNHPLHRQYPQTILKQWMTFIYVDVNSSFVNRNNTVLPDIHQRLFMFPVLCASPSPTVDTLSTYIK